MSGYTPLFQSIVTSSVWSESHTVRVVWVTMLALADSEGVVEGSIIGLAHVARVTVEECEAALKCLSSPDKYSRTHEHEGRRIAEVPGGWLVLNLKDFRERAKGRAAYYRKWRKNKQKANNEPET
jgi:hypothetical protein